MTAQREFLLGKQYSKDLPYTITDHRLQTLATDQVYQLDVGGDGTEDMLRISSLSGIIVNESSTALLISPPSAFLIQDGGGQFRVLLSAPSGNDYYDTYVFSLKPEGAKLLERMDGQVVSIDPEKGEFQFEVVNALFGYQRMDETYRIAEDGRLEGDGSYRIESDFTLIRDMPVLLRNSGEGRYTQARLGAGETLTLLETDMKSQLSFRRQDGTEGYIEMVPYTGEEHYTWNFSVDGVNLLDYFNVEHIGWAG